MTITLSFNAANLSQLSSSALRVTRDLRPALRAALCLRQQHEVHRRDEARALLQSARTSRLRRWVSAVGAGSKAAVAAAKRV